MKLKNKSHILSNLKKDFEMMEKKEDCADLVNALCQISDVIADPSNNGIEDFDDLLVRMQVIINKILKREGEVVIVEN